MREVEAFSYWPDHASAIHGFGGRRRSPDPRYCFHTMYNDARPGPARYVLRLRGIKASHGELSLRVHAFRPPNDVQISLVAGTRLTFAEIAQDDVSVEVRFSVLRGVLYAFYGYFSEDSDIEADHVSVELHEYEGEDTDAFIEPPRSALAVDAGSSDARPANALIHFGTVDVMAPVSQDCTLGQLSEGATLDERMTHWREQACLAALPAYGATLSGLDGLVLGPVGDDVHDALAAQPFIVQHAQDAGGFLAAVSPEHFIDFLLWPQGPDRRGEPEARWAAVETALGRLKIGGLAAIGMTYRARNGLLSSSIAADHRELSRNEIGQWALRLIGNGYSVAPLAFAAERDLPRLDDDGASFILIVRRQ